MKKIAFYLFIIIHAIFFTACSTTNNNITPRNNFDFYHSDKEFNDINVSKALIDQFKEWRGTQYKYGGNSKNGIDCSYFVQDTFNSKLHMQVPRTTYYQSRIGENIKKSDINIGDLVFFQTSPKGRHVGIYLKDGDFMHVSTSKGVIISNLNNPYWSKHYWKSKRVLVK